VANEAFLNGLKLPKKGEKLSLNKGEENIVIEKNTK